jgi:hypothetical protein
MHIRTGYPLYCDEADARKNYYEPPHIYGWLYYDGDRHGFTNYATWRALITARMAVPAPVTITMWGDYTPFDGTGTVHVQFRNDSTDVLTGRVIMVVTEDSLYYVGPNLDTIHNYVARDYLPDENGSMITIDPGDSLTLTEQFVIDSTWVERSCRIVAWFQNDSAYADSTREVWQGSVATIGELIGVAENRMMIPDNQTPIPTTIFSGPIDLPSDKRYKILDITGRYVDIQGMKPGIYYVEIEGEISHKVVKVQ